MAIINSKVTWNTNYDKNGNHRYTEYYRSMCVIFTNRKQIPQGKEEKCISHELLV